MAVSVVRNFGRGIRKAAGATVEAVAQGATMAVAAPIAAGATMAGGAAKHTIKGMGKGFKSVGQMRRRFLGETAEAAVKQGSPKAIVDPVTKFDYRQRVVDGKEVFERRPNGADDSAWGIVDTDEYKNARRSSHSKTAEFTYESTASSSDLPAVIADENAKSGAGFWSGLGGMIQDHPYVAAGIAGGVGVAGGALLFDDDDDY